MLGKAHQLFMKRWKSGARNRETALRLLFLNWLALVEPPFLTGLDDEEINKEFNKELFYYLGGELSNDPEFLLVLSVMWEIGEWVLGEEKFWNEVGKNFCRRLSSIDKTPLSKEVFKNRGEYGHYFTKQLKFH